MLISSRVLQQKRPFSVLQQLDQLRRNPSCDRRALHAEREIATKTHERHFPDLETMHIRDGVDPLRKRVVVPRLPHDAANERTGSEAHDQRPVAGREDVKHTLLLQCDLDDDKHHQRRNP